MENKLAFVVVNININYRRPALLGDVLIVRSRLEQLNGKSGVIQQEVLLEGDGTPVADAALTFVCIDLRTQKRCLWKAICARVWKRCWSENKTFAWRNPVSHAWRRYRGRKSQWRGKGVLANSVLYKQNSRENPGCFMASRLSAGRFSASCSA